MEKHSIIDPKCSDCDLRDADCFIEEDRHICMPEKQIGYKIVRGVLETIEIVEGFEDG